MQYSIWRWVGRNNTLAFTIYAQTHTHTHIDISCLMRSSILNGIKQFFARRATFRRMRVCWRAKKTHTTFIVINTKFRMCDMCVCVLGKRGDEKKWHQMSLTFSNSQKPERNRRKWQATTDCCKTEANEKKSFWWQRCNGYTCLKSWNEQLNTVSYDLRQTRMERWSTTIQRKSYNIRWCTGTHFWRK